MIVVDVGPDLQPLKRSLPGDDRFSLDGDVCECGIPLDVHPPLPDPGPFRTWRSERSGPGWGGDLDMDGNPRTIYSRAAVTPEVAARRKAALGNVMRRQQEAGYRTRVGR